MFGPIILDQVTITLGLFGLIPAIAVLLASVCNDHQCRIRRRRK